MKKYEITIGIYNGWVRDYCYDNEIDYGWKIQKEFVEDIKYYTQDLQDDINELNKEKNIKYISFKFIDNEYSGYIIIKLESDLSEDEIEQKITELFDYEEMYQNYIEITLSLLKEPNKAHSRQVGRIKSITEIEKE